MDFDNWNILKKSLESIHRPHFHKGEVWFLSLGKNIGDEEDGKNRMFERPVLIIRKFNNNIFLAVPLTSRQKQGKYYYSLESFRPSVVMLSQIRILDSKRLLRKVGTVHALDVDNVKNKIRSIL